MNTIQRLFLGLVLIASHGLQSQDFSDQYSKIFRAEKMQYGERSFLMVKTQLLLQDEAYAELVNPLQVYLDYLRTHFTGALDHEALMALEDSTLLQSRYIEFLQQDSLFQATLAPWMAHYQGTDVAKDSLSMDQLLNVAVKYFTINRITPEGYYSGKVCAGINGIQTTLSKRQPHVEAFCFQAIRNNMQSEEFPLYDEFVKGIRKLYQVELGQDPDEKLLRAQGVMYFYMRNNAVLQDLLRKEYEAKKELLPFALKL